MHPLPAFLNVIMKNPQYILNYDVMYYDTDCGGVVHNLAYLRWVEECRTKMAPELGIDFLGLIKENRHLGEERYAAQLKAKKQRSSKNSGKKDIR